MIVYAREKGYMRLQPIIGTVFLSTLDDYSLFKRVFMRVMKTPNDVIDFINICRNGNIRKGLGRKIKRVINEWLYKNINEYWALKYKNQLRIIIRLCHPNFSKISIYSTLITDWIMDFQYPQKLDYLDVATDMLESHCPQISAYIDMISATSAQQILNAIKEGRLPYEIVTGAIKPEADGWKELMKQMPYFALLRHLVTFYRNGLFDDKEVVDYIYKRLIDKKAVKTAMILPFRFLEPMKRIIDRKIQKGLEKAFDNSFDNLEPIEGEIVIATDMSGSMDSPISRKSSIKFCDIAGILTAGIYWKNKDHCRVLPFNSHVLEFSPRSFKRAIDIAQWFHYPENGTNLSAPIEFMEINKIKADVFIGITDNEEWMGTGVMNALKSYRMNINPNMHAFLIRIDPYVEDVALNLDDPLNHIISGWSDNILGFINIILKGEDLISKIQEYFPL